MLLSDFIIDIKRTTHVGDVSVIDDQTTLDILTSLGNFVKSIWSMHEWSDLITEFSITPTVGVQNYTLADATISKIIAIDDNNGGTIKRTALKDYLKWYRDSNGDPNSEPISRYVPIGRDKTTRALKIKFCQIPTTATAHTAWGKGRYTLVTQADISAGTNALIDFPDDFDPIARAYVLGDVYEGDSKPIQAEAKRNEFLNAVNRKIGEEETQLDDEATFPVPDLIRFRRRHRGGSGMA